MSHLFWKSFHSIKNLSGRIKDLSIIDRWLAHIQEKGSIVNRVFYLNLQHKFFNTYVHTYNPNPTICVDPWIQFTCSNFIHYPIVQYNYDFFSQNENIVWMINVFKNFTNTNVRHFLQVVYKVNCVMGEFQLTMSESCDALW